MNTHRQPVHYPFDAIVGQSALKLCLMLAAIDWRLSLLLGGEKGSGKSTAARALPHILPGDPPFVNVPIGVTDDRLLGSLDLKAALDSQLQLRRGLIDEAHGGVLYIDEVNLLAGHLADALLDVSATGYYVLERDGLSHSRPCHFTLLGSMNLEEGQLRPQLLDRFALALDVCAPHLAEERKEILVRRLCFDDDPAAFVADYHSQDLSHREAIATARSGLRAVGVPGDALQHIATRIGQCGVRSLRADLATVRASRALAALQGSTRVTEEHIETVLPFVLLHRAKDPLPPPSPPPPPPPEDPGPSEERPNEHRESPQRPQPECVFAPRPEIAGKLHARLPSASQRGRAHTEANGSSRPAQHSPQSAGVDLVRSLVETARVTGRAFLREDTLVPRPVRHTSGVRYLFLVDSSGSQSARSRMRAVKGAAIALLDSSASPEDEVAVVAFRGAAAQVLLPPSRSVDDARKKLELLPTGGRTPLAHGLAAARELATPSTVLVLLTDGQANVPLHGGDPWQEALALAALFNCPALVVDNASDARQHQRVDALCRALRASRVPLHQLESQSILEVSRLTPNS